MEIYGTSISGKAPVVCPTEMPVCFRWSLTSAGSQKNQIRHVHGHAQVQHICNICTQLGTRTFTVQIAYTEN